MTSVFPDNEKYGLCSQMNRCAVSIPSNIAEGCSRNSNKDFARFLEIAIGSAFEVETQVEIARRRKYLNDEAVQDFFAKIQQLQRRLSSFRNFLLKQN